MLGILRAEKSAAAAILINRGLDLGKAREAVIKVSAEDKSRSASHRTEASILIRGIDQLLDRLAAFTSNSDEARSLIDEIRQRVRALAQQLRR